MNGVWNAKAIKAIDFAGGTVVHMTSGWSALVLCIILGKRLGFGKDNMAPHSMVLCMVGTGMLWVGWYGFNAGSAVAADGIAANAFTTTTLATAVGSFVWALIEYICAASPASSASARRRRRPGRHHPGLRLRHADRRRDHRRAGRRRPVLLRLQVKGCSATTTRSTPSASTPSAAPWAPSSPASWPQPSGKVNSKPQHQPRRTSTSSSTKGIWLRAAQGHRRHHRPLRRRHARHRLHRQAQSSACARRRKSKARASTSPTTARRATSSKRIFLVPRRPAALHKPPAPGGR
jgi:hypothetical protein